MWNVECGEQVSFNMHWMNNEKEKPKKQLINIWTNAARACYYILADERLWGVLIEYLVATTWLMTVLHENMHWILDPSESAYSFEH